VRKLALFPLLILALALGLAACGGGSSSSAGSTTSSGGSGSGSGESPWAKEVTEVMSEFENSKAGQVVEQIHTSTSKPILEPLYLTYTTNLLVLAKKIEGTKAPASCVALRKKMVADARQVAAVTKVLGHQSQLTPEQYSLKAYKKGLKIDRLGRNLGALAGELSC
jgi:hypothetical protein